MAKTDSRKYENVLFEWFGGAGDSSLRGTVIVRGEEMVLDIPDTDYGGHYSIVGKRAGHTYSGKHDLRGDDSRVEAKWTDLDDLYIGTWLEDDFEFLFRFRLPGAHR